MYTESYKQQVYKKWIERGRPWFDTDPSKEATPEEREIAIEMKKREAGIKENKSNNEIKQFHEMLNLDNY